MSDDKKCGCGDGKKKCCEQEDATKDCDKDSCDCDDKDTCDKKE